MPTRSPGVYYESDRFTVVSITGNIVTMFMNGNERNIVTAQMSEFSAAHQQQAAYLHPGDKVYRGNGYFYFVMQAEFA